MNRQAVAAIVVATGLLVVLLMYLGGPSTGPELGRVERSRPEAPVVARAEPSTPAPRAGSRPEKTKSKKPRRRKAGKRRGHEPLARARLRPLGPRTGGPSMPPIRIQVDARTHFSEATHEALLSTVEKEADKRSWPEEQTADVLDVLDESYADAQAILGDTPQGAALSEQDQRDLDAVRADEQEQLRDIFGDDVPPFLRGQQRLRRPDPPLVQQPIDE